MPELGFLRKYSVEVETLTELLGTQPSQAIRQKYLESREDEKVYTEEEKVEVRPVTFFTNSGKICILDYQWKGWCKEAFAEFPHLLGIKGRTKEWASAGTVKGRVDKWLFVHPRYILPTRDGKGIEKPDGVLERFMRSSMRGIPVVTPVASDYLTPPANIRFEVWVLAQSPIDMEVLHQVLQYGEVYGLLGWRNAGFGRFRLIGIEQLV